MIKRIITFIKAPWICSVVTKTVQGISSVLVVLKFAREQIEGSEAGDNAIKIIAEVEGFLEVALKTLKKTTGFICGSTDVEVKTQSLDDAIKTLSSVTKELKDL